MSSPHAMFPPPPVNGLGQTGGFKLQIEDRAGLGYPALDEATKAVLAKAYQTPELAGIFSSFPCRVEIFPSFCFLAHLLLFAPCWAVWVGETWRVVGAPYLFAHTVKEAAASAVSGLRLR